MRKSVVRLTLAVAIAIALPSSAWAGPTAPPPPQNLRVSGGEETWRSENDYHLYWDNPAVDKEAPPIVSVHYLVRDASGAAVSERGRIDWGVDSISELMVPDLPGIYTAEVWFKNSHGEEGPPVSATLRFDSARPAQVEPIRSGWIGRAAFPYIVRFGYPRDQLPASGIGGYAVSVDSATDGDPCAAPERCTAAETDLRAGLDGNAFAIAGLPEGRSHIHAVAVSGSGMKSGSIRHGVLDVDLTDPTTRLIGVPGGWTNKSVTVTAIATDTGSGMEIDTQGPVPFTAIRVDGGLPKIATGSSVSATAIADGAHRIDFYARDAAGNVNDGGSTNGLLNSEPSTALVRIDRGAPSVAFANSEDPLNPESIHVRVHDSLSGPEPRRGSIGVRLAGSGDRFEELNTEPAAGGFRASWDSESYPPGEYEFRASGYDAAGNDATTASRANGARMILSNPVKELSALQAGFGGRTLIWHRCLKLSVGRRCRREEIREFAQRPTERVVPFGHGAMFSGRLSAGLGAPLAGMEVRIVELFGTGPNPAERISKARTTEDGTFSLRLAPGPSREVIVGFAGTPTLTRSAARSVQLGVRSAVSLHASSAVARVGGRPVIFSGKVAASIGDIPAEGKTVQLQFRLPGLPWAEFRTIQTDGRGRFRYAYRFSDDDSRGVRFQFRAYAPAQGDWPYEPGGSKPAAVLGR